MLEEEVLNLILTGSQFPELFVLLMLNLTSKSVYVLGMLVKSILAAPPEPTTTLLISV
jgi:hypothetical protein